MAKLIWEKKKTLKIAVVNVVNVINKKLKVRVWGHTIDPEINDIKLVGQKIRHF